MRQAPGAATNAVIGIDLDQPVDDAVDCATHPFQQRRVERVAHDHETISVEQFDSSSDIGRFHQFEIGNTVLTIEPFAERNNIRVVVPARPADDRRVTSDQVVVLRCGLLQSLIALAIRDCNEPSN